MSTEAKRRKKNYYVDKTKKARGNFLDCNVENGFLVTIDPKQERRATLTAYSLLNEAADRLYGPEEKSEEKETDDIETELNAIRKDGCRFKKLRTDFPANIFIRTTLAKPLEIISDVFEHMPKTVNSILRFVAVLGICKTQPEIVSKKVLEILQANYPEGVETITFMVQLKARHNNEYKDSAKRQEFCRNLAKSIQEENSSFVPDLKDPSLVINIDVLQKIACVSLLPHFKRFKKYNPEQFAERIPDKALLETDAQTAQVDEEQKIQPSESNGKEKSETVVVEEDAANKVADKE